KASDRNQLFIMPKAILFAASADFFNIKRIIRCSFYPCTFNEG
ncbi:MAG: hypothetical protein ACI9YE_002838, partial [Psychroserpens sp.]